MRVDARSKIISELTAEFVEERVREMPGKLFSIEDIKRSLSATLRDAGEAAVLMRDDDAMIATYLDRHPFLLKAKAGSKSHWKPGLNLKR